MERQNDRISYTLSYRNLIVGGNDYHPEKIDISLTRSIDIIPSETKEETINRIKSLDVFEDELKKVLDERMGGMIKSIKSKVRNRKQ